MNKSSRNADKKGEQLISNILDKTFYPNIVESLNGVGEQITDRGMQLLGADYGIAFKSSGKINKIYFDEKVALHYLNRNLKTYSFELQRLINTQSGIIDCLGWFMDKSLITTTYVLVYLKSDKCSDYKQLKSIDDLTSMQVITLDKKQLIKYLQSIGISHELLLTSIKKLRKTQEYSIRLKNGLKLVQSNNLMEKPINLIIPKKTLINIANGYSIFSDGKWEYHF